MTKDLWKALNRAEKEYLRLMDAKSNGCLSGKPILEVLEYDKKIEQAWLKCRRLHEQCMNLLVKEDK